MKSHSQQKNGPLRSISKGGKVYRLDDNLHRSLNLETSKLEFRFALKGVGESSVFPGFCQKHERLFSVFENSALNPGDERQAWGLFYRTFAYEKARKRREHFRWRTLQAELAATYPPLNLASITPYVDGFREHIRSTCDYHLKVARQMLDSGDFSDLRTVWLVLSSNVGVSCSSAINLHLDNYGEYILANPGKPIPSFTFNLIPGPCETHVLLSWLKEFDSEAHWLAQAVNCTHSVEFLLNRLSFCDSEDACVNPSLWESIENPNGLIDSMRHVQERGLLHESQVPQIIKVKGVSLNTSINRTSADESLSE